jgi:hypothetical protein
MAKFSTKRDYILDAATSGGLTKDAAIGVGKLAARDGEAYDFLNWRLERATATTPHRAASWLNGHYEGAKATA